MTDIDIDDRGPHEQYQMYSREGNDAVAAMVAQVQAEALAHRMMRGGIVEALAKGMVEVRKAHPEIHDTEPEWEIVDVMNAFLAEHGFLPIGRDDLG